MELFNLAKEQGYTNTGDVLETLALLYPDKYSPHLIEEYKFIKLTLIQKWLRDTKGLDINVVSNKSVKNGHTFYWGRVFKDSLFASLTSSTFKSYEQALEDTILIILELIKEKKW